VSLNCPLAFIRHCNH